MNCYQTCVKNMAPVKSGHVISLCEMSKPVPHPACGKNHPTKVVFFRLDLSGSGHIAAHSPSKPGHARGHRPARRSSQASVFLGNIERVRHRSYTDRTLFNRTGAPNVPLPTGANADNRPGLTQAQGSVTQNQPRLPTTYVCSKSSSDLIR